MGLRWGPSVVRFFHERGTPVDPVNLFTLCSAAVSRMEKQRSLESKIHHAVGVFLLARYPEPASEGRRSHADHGRTICTVLLDPRDP